MGTLVQTAQYIYENQEILITVVYEILLRSYYFFSDVIICPMAVGFFNHSFLEIHTKIFMDEII